MGKFDKYKNKNFQTKGLLSVAILGLIILIWVFKRYNDKKQEKEEDKKVRNRKKNDDLEPSENEEDNHKEEVYSEQTQHPHKITGPLKKKLIDKSYNPINKEFLKEAKKVIKQVNKNNKIV